MAVGLYCMNFLVPIRTIEEKYPGGWKQCLKDHAQWLDGKVWFDQHLFHDGSMNPNEIEELIKKWQKMGFTITDQCDGRMVWKDVACIEYADHLYPDWLAFTSNGTAAYLAGTEVGETIKPTWLKKLIEKNVGSIELSVTLGQTLYVEAEIYDGKLKYLLPVEQVINPDKTIVITLDKHKHGGTILSLSQPFKKNMKFDVEILLCNGRLLPAASILPVPAGKTLMEMWPEDISKITLKNAKLISTHSFIISDDKIQKLKIISLEMIEGTKQLVWIWWAFMTVFCFNQIRKIL